MKRFACGSTVEREWRRSAWRSGPAARSQSAWRPGVGGRLAVCLASGGRLAVSLAPVARSVRPGARPTRIRRRELWHRCATTNGTQPDQTGRSRRRRRRNPQGPLQSRDTQGRVSRSSWGSSPPSRTRNLRPLRHPSERGVSLFGFLVTHPPLPVTHDLARAGGFGRAGGLGTGAATLCRAGLAAVQLPRRAGFRGARVAEVIAVAGSSSTTRSGGSGATLPTTRRVRARRAVAPSM